jgi:hypothetical protein
VVTWVQADSTVRAAVTGIETTVPHSKIDARCDRSRRSNSAGKTAFSVVKAFGSES